MDRTTEQKSGIRNTLIFLVGFMAAMIGLLLYAALGPKDLTEQQKQELGYFQYEQGRVLKDFTLQNHDGKAVNKDSFKGQWSLVFFGFTACPDVCPTTMGVLSRAVDKMNTKPQVVMVSVDPERDSVERLSQYVPAFNQDFVGYTGDFDEIVGLATQLNAAFGKVPGPMEGSYTVDHSATISVLNPEGQYHGFLKVPHDATKISTVMNRLMR